MSPTLKKHTIPDILQCWDNWLSMDSWLHSSAMSKLNFLSFEHCVVFMQENIPWINNTQYFEVKEHRIFNCSEIVQEKKKRKTTTHKKWNMNRMKRQKRHWKMTPQVSRCPTGYWRRAENSLQEEWRDGANAKAMPSCGWDRWWE